MKYQIYLNKKASATIEELSRFNGIKASTFIKQIMEQFADQAQAKMETIKENIIKEHENQKQ